jgi:hypothetical protein
MPWEQQRGTKNAITVSGATIGGNVIVGRIWSTVLISTM